MVWPTEKRGSATNAAGRQLQRVSVPTSQQPAARGRPTKRWKEALVDVVRANILGQNDLTRRMQKFSQSE